MGIQSACDDIQAVNRRNEKVFQEFQEFRLQASVRSQSRQQNLSSTEALLANRSRGQRKKAGKVFANLVSTFCYLSLEGELGQLLHGRRRQRLLRGHPHAAKHHDDHGEDEEHAARHINEDIGIEVVLPQAHLCPATEKSRYYHLLNTETNFSSIFQAVNVV